MLQTLSILIQNLRNQQTVRRSAGVCTCANLRVVLVSACCIKLAAVPMDRCLRAPPRQVYYLFSNNHINEIVSMHFDFDDDEVLVSSSLRGSQRRELVHLRMLRCSSYPSPDTTPCGIHCCRATTSTC